MSNRANVRSAFDNLRPTILREPSRSSVTPEAEANLLGTAGQEKPSNSLPQTVENEKGADTALAMASAPLLVKKNRERLLLVSFRMPQGLKEKLERAAKQHEINQTDLINEAIELNLQRYL